MSLIAKSGQAVNLTKPYDIDYCVTKGYVIRAEQNDFFSVQVELTEATGREHVQNGDFLTGLEWTFGNNWSWNNIKFVADAAAAEETEFLLQALNQTVDGQYYKLEFELLNYNAGRLYVSFGGNEFKLKHIDSNGLLADGMAGNGKYVAYGYKGTANNDLVFRGGTVASSQAFTGSLDNISMKEMSMPIINVYDCETNSLVYSDDNVNSSKMTYYSEHTDIQTNESGVVRPTVQIDFDWSWLNLDEGCYYVCLEDAIPFYETGATNVLLNPSFDEILSGATDTAGASDELIDSTATFNQEGIEAGNLWDGTAAQETHVVKVKSDTVIQSIDPVIAPPASYNILRDWKADFTNGFAELWQYQNGSGDVFFKQPYNSEGDIYQEIDIPDDSCNRVKVDVAFSDVNGFVKVLVSSGGVETEIGEMITTGIFTFDFSGINADKVILRAGYKASQPVLTITLNEVNIYQKPGCILCSPCYILKDKHEYSSLVTFRSTQNVLLGAGAYIDNHSFYFLQGLRVLLEVSDMYADGEADIYNYSNGAKEVAFTDRREIYLMKTERVSTQVHQSLYAAVQNELFYIDGKRFVVEDTSYSPRHSRMSSKSPVTLEVTPHSSFISHT